MKYEVQRVHVCIYTCIGVTEVRKHGLWNRNYYIDRNFRREYIFMGTFEPQNLSTRKFDTNELLEQTKMYHTWSHTSSRKCVHFRYM